MNKGNRYQSRILLVGEILLLASTVVWDEIREDAVWPVWLYLLILGAGGYSLINSRKWLSSFLLIGLVGVGFGNFGAGVPLCEVVSVSAFAFSFALLFRAVVNHCFFNPGVSKGDRILGGIAGYLLLGIFWMSQSAWARMLHPDAFAHASTGEAATPTELLYYSFITLTGVGYGDFVPTTSLARLIAILNGLSGVLYIAVFIAALLERGTDAGKH
ncbi:MAG: potassium channel family protein [Verrucomicrobiales bacterium]|nr:potassium channel family protein [Verrucomicrobiales bacterium]